MLDRVKNYIRENEMISPGDGVIAGISGGADSVCLLWILHQLKEELHFEITVVHVNHGLRGEEAGEDQHYVEHLCETLKIPCVVYCKDVRKTALSEGMSEEEAGRKLRYQCFYEVMKQTNGNKIAAAHHKDDSAETILFHLFRGSGFKGLSGIQGVRDPIIRPLLCCRRIEIEEYLNAQEISWRTDSTNLENEYTRNKIRNQLVPFITEHINHQAVEHILWAGELFKEAEDYFSGIAKEISGNHVRVEENRISVVIEPLKVLNPIIQRYLVRDCYRMLAKGLKDFTAGHSSQVLELMEKETGRQVSLPGGILASKNYKELVFVKSEKEEEEELVPPDYIFRRFLWKKESEIPKNRYTKWFDYVKIQDTLKVRTREKGDYILLPGGGRKSVKSFMIDQKIPRSMRSRIWLLADGHHIVWIIGYRISEGYKITQETKEVLEVKVLWRDR